MGGGGRHKRPAEDMGQISDLPPASDTIDTEEVRSSSAVVSRVAIIHSGRPPSPRNGVSPAQWRSQSLTLGTRTETERKVSATAKFASRCFPDLLMGEYGFTISLDHDRVLYGGRPRNELRLGRVLFRATARAFLAAELFQFAAQRFPVGAIFGLFGASLGVDFGTQRVKFASGGVGEERPRGE